MNSCAFCSTPCAWVKQNREIAIDAMMKFSELDRELAARTYDGMIGTLTTNRVVDKETRYQKHGVIE